MKDYPDNCVLNSECPAAEQACRVAAVDGEGRAKGFCVPAAFTFRHYANCVSDEEGLRLLS